MARTIVISGAGAVIQAGRGTTTLTADSAYTGNTAVNAGALLVGDAAHPVAALSGGGLGSAAQLDDALSVYATVSCQRGFNGGVRYIGGTSGLRLNPG